ncbi:hypothetical protein E5676_scaffold313G00590 [Cucumis melo var. makuwa]|uniref:Uncharacterized protein n=1 Tax=Cucumis melo var. makuwa TaxID=1194695 RepID=A0A5A7U1R8_CUCMM|nr:hypothetical protein E6C27_scaffold498G001520 [Cucumis melo var. makuwa]TYK26490.1 hypothetical protein E5676_scaffold313G00590 [Cucumis melo var. makuwa]
MSATHNSTARPSQPHPFSISFWPHTTTDLPTASVPTASGIPSSVCRPVQPRRPGLSSRPSPSSPLIRDLTLKFSGPTASSFGNSSLYSVDLLSVDSIEGHNQVSGKGYSYYWTSDRAWKRSNPQGITLVASVPSGVRSCLRIDTDVRRLRRASFGITRLICASLGITRLIGVSFGITRLIRASFGITGLMCKGTARGRPTRARSMREGHMDASGFLYASADVFC